MERQQGGAVEAWTNDALQWRHVVYLFRFVRSFVFFTSKYWLSKRDKKYTARRVHKSCGYTYVLKTNERIRQKWTRKNLRIDDDSVDISCVDVTGICFFFCFVGRVKFSQLSTSSSVWWCVHKCRKSGSWEISSSTKPKLVTGAGRDTRGGKITSRKTGDSPIGMRGIGMQIRRRHQSISQQRKNEKHWTTRNRLEIFFSRGFPTRCDRAGNQTRKKKKIPIDQQQHWPQSLRSNRFLHVIPVFNFPGGSWRIAMIMHGSPHPSAATPQNPTKWIFLLGCHCCFPPFQKQSNNIIFTLSLPKQKITKKSHHQTDRSITNDSERHAK